MLKLWNKSCSVTRRIGQVSCNFPTEQYKIWPFLKNTSQIVLILEWFMWHDWYNFRARKLSVFVLPFCFLRKGTKGFNILELSIISGKRKHAYWVIIPRIVSPRKLCIYVLWAEVISQRLLVIGESDNAISSAPILTSMISDLHYVLEKWTNQHRGSILFLAMGKSLSKWLKSAQNALA